MPIAKRHIAPSPEDQILHMKAIAPVQIYLVPTHDDDRGRGWLTQVWCDEPAPTPDHNPEDAVGYLRFDEHAAQVRDASTDRNRLQHHNTQLREHLGRLVRQVELLGLRRTSLRAPHEAEIEDELLRLAADAGLLIHQQRKQLEG